MNKPTLIYTLIAILGIGVIAALGVQSYYTHELARRIADQPDSGWSHTSPTASTGLWDPEFDLQRLQARIDQAFDQSFNVIQDEGSGAATRITLEQNADNYVVKAAIPGAKKDDIRFRLEGRLLSISSHTRGSEKQTAQNGAITSESSYSGAFEEAFTLPGPVSDAGMTSAFKDGVLTLTIPKATS